MNDEVWKSVPDFPMYEASSLGRVRSKYNRGLAGEFLKGRADKDGYLGLTLCRDKQRFSFRLHHIILMAFVGPKPEWAQVGCHNDGDLSNNRIDNLRWDTQKGNIADKFQHGTLARGERNAKAKLTAEQVLAIRADARSNREIAAEYGMDRTQIANIRSRKQWAWLA